VITKLGANLRNMYVNGSGSNNCRVSPDFREQLITAKDPALIGHEVL
jgi:hypothetical protein